MTSRSWTVIFPLLLGSPVQLAAAYPQSSGDPTTFATPTTYVTSLQTTAPVSTTLGAPSPGATLTGRCVGQCTIYPYTCGVRATCELFNPNTPASTFGQRFCVCQAGYRATGVDPKDINQQYHLTWRNANGDQTHRVFVKPGQDCTALCSDVNCSEVPLKDTCR